MLDRVLVTDGEKRISLSLIRSLGKRGIKVDVGSESFYSIGFTSRYCYKRSLYKSPKKNPEAFFNYLLKKVKKNKYKCIFPVRENTAKVISKYKNELSKYTKVPVPDYPSFQRAFNKEEVLKIAIKKGISCPKSYFENDVDTIADQIKFPVILKSKSRHGSKVSICQSKNELKIMSKLFYENIGPFFIQEFIPNGGELGVYTLFNSESKPYALSVHQRIRTVHTYGGVSTFRKTIRNDHIVKIAFDLLKAINWVGPAMVEFRVDSRDNTPKFIEINPRWWGSLPLSIFSGPDFPYLLYKNEVDGKIKPNLNYKIGVNCRCFYGDIIWYMNSKNKLKNLNELFDFSTNFDIISLKDPLPAFFAPITISREVLTR